MLPAALARKEKPQAEARATLALAGKICSTSLGALRRRIDRARKTRGGVVIDLSEVTLIDKPALEFLATQSSAEVEIINCPAYIEPWLRKEAL